MAYTTSSFPNKAVVQCQNSDLTLNSLVYRKSERHYNNTSESFVLGTVEWAINVRMQITVNCINKTKTEMRIGNSECSWSPWNRGRGGSRRVELLPADLRRKATTTTLVYWSFSSTTRVTEYIRMSKMTDVVMTTGVIDVRSSSEIVSTNLC